GPRGRLHVGLDIHTPVRIHRDVEGGIDAMHLFDDHRAIGDRAGAVTTQPIDHLRRVIDAHGRMDPITRPTPIDGKGSDVGASQPPVLVPGPFQDRGVRTTSKKALIHHIEEVFRTQVRFRWRDAQWGRGWQSPKHLLAAPLVYIGWGHHTRGVLADPLVGIRWKREKLSTQSGSCVPLQARRAYGQEDEQPHQHAAVSMCHGSTPLTILFRSPRQMCPYIRYSRRYCLLEV